MKITGVLLVAVVEITPASAFAQSIAVPVPIERVELGVGTGMLRKVVAHGDRLYALDVRNHHLLMMRGKTATAVGRIGNGEGDLYQPFDFAVDNKLWIYVKENGNKRIDIFDDNGKYVSGFPDVPKSLGLAVTSGGEILLGQPQLGSLVTVYDSHGKKRRSFGTLVRPSEMYGTAFKRFDGNLPMFNRVRIATDDAGNVWVGFAYMPLLCKFGPDGNLLLRKQLEYPELAPVIAGVGVLPPPEQFASMNLDGMQLTMVIRDISWDAGAKRLLVLLGNERTVMFNTEGREISGFRPAEDLGSLQNVSVRAGGEVLATIFGSPNIYRLGVRR